MGVVNKFPDSIFRARTKCSYHTQTLEVLFPRYHGLVCWKPAFCAHRVWRNYSFYQEVQRSLCDYRDGGSPWTMRLHKILFQVRENCYRILWNVEDSFWGTSHGSFPNISVVFPGLRQAEIRLMMKNALVDHCPVQRQKWLRECIRLSVRIVVVPLMKSVC